MAVGYDMMHIQEFLILIATTTYLYFHQHTILNNQQNKIKHFLIWVNIDESRVQPHYSWDMATAENLSDMLDSLTILPRPTHSERVAN